jgi:hypothetical protein
VILECLFQVDGSDYRVLMVMRDDDARNVDFVLFVDDTAIAKESIELIESVVASAAIALGSPASKESTLSWVRDNMKRLASESVARERSERHKAGLRQVRIVKNSLLGCDKRNSEVVKTVGSDRWYGERPWVLVQQQVVSKKKKCGDGYAK